MDKSVLMAITVVFLLGMLALLIVGWRNRKKRQGDIAPLAAVPADLGTAFGTFDGKYVATTAGGDPFDRIAVRGLGFRGNASVTVASGGALVQRPGESDIWIPAGDLRGIRRATWTIDRVVEEDGLQLIEWMLGARVVDTYLRMNDPKAFEGAVEPLITTERQAL